MNAEGKQQSLLTFRVGPVLCCAPSLPVETIITPPKLTHVAGSEPSTPGIFKHGSHIVKVIDLRLKFGVDKAQHTHPGNLIITISEAGNFAYWVDQILDVFDFPKEGWGNLPPAIPRGIFTHTLLLNNKIHLYSEFEKLSRISNLGYLEHYILQLTQTESTQPAKEKISTTEITTAEITSTKNTTPGSTASAEIKPDEGDKPVSTLTTTHASEPKSSAPVVTNSSTLANKQSPDANHRGVTSAPPLATTKSSGSVSKAIPSSHTGSLTARVNPVLNSTTSSSTVIKSTAASQPSAAVTSISTTSQQKKKNPADTFSSSLNTEVDTEETAIQKPPASTAYSQADKNNDDDDTSFFAIFLFLILLILLPGAGIYYYFSQESTVRYRHLEKPGTSKNNFTQKKVIKMTQTETKKETVPTIPGVHSSLEQARPAIMEPEHRIDNETLNENVAKSINTKKSPPASEYYADIIQDENEITITIHQPAAKENTGATAKVIAPLSIDDTADVDTVAVIETLPVTPLKDDEIAKPITKEKVINEIVHVVVKGDTLWAIAKKYVKNPFLYPELARLSNITNPHRIYPGNRVRIRFTHN